MATRLAIAAILLLASAAAAAGEEGAGKVAVALYYESLCPYSARFVVNHLAEVFVDGLLEVVDLTLVPYGNARIHPGEVISCQVESAARPSPGVSLCSFVRNCGP
jgi:interferon gamma-inducible protein 30